MTAPTRVMTPAEFAAVFEQLVIDLGQVAADGLAKSYELWRSGELTGAQFEDLIVRALIQTNGYAWAGADLIGTTYVGDLTGRQLAVTGTAPVSFPAELDRLGQAAATLAKAVDTDADVPMMLDRMARNEPAQAAQAQMVSTYRAHGVSGYRRHLNPGACELCVWLQKAHLDPEGIGFIYPTGQSFHRHTGCRCTPVPAIRKATR